MTKSHLGLILVFSVQIFSARVLAKLDHDSTQPVRFPASIEPQENITSKDIEKVIPLDLAASGDMNAVANRIADRGLQSWFNSPQVQGSSLGQTASSVQKTMGTDLIIKSSEGSQAVEHKFSMQVLALQAMARLQYSGFLHAAFNYDARAAQSMVEFSDKIFNKDLFVNHTSSLKEDDSSIGVKWGW
jgi:hypothetical protein